MTSHIRRIAAAAFFVYSIAGAAHAEEHLVEMLNTDGEGKRMLFKPDFLKVNVGDSVKFILKQMPHNAESIPELWPEGAPTFKGKINEEISYTIEQPGIYGVKCTPHYMMGMIALIVAGDEQPNQSQLESYKPKGPETAKRFEALKAELGK